MSEKDNAIQLIAGSIVDAIKARRSAVVFVRCTNNASINDVETSLGAFSSHVQWVSARLKSSLTIDRLNTLKSEDPRTVIIVHPMTEETLLSLNIQREAFDSSKIRAVFLLTTRDVRVYARLLPEFWEKRDCFTSWPDPSEFRPGPGGMSYEEQLVKGVEQRVQTALKMDPGYQRGKTIFTACRDAFYSGNPGPASKYMVDAITDLRGEASTIEMAEAFQMLGSVAETRSDLDRAFDWLNESLRFWQQSGKPDGLADIYGRLGALSYRMDDIDAASKYLEQAAEMEETLGNPTRLCDIYRHLGMVREREDSLTDAERLYHRSEKIAREIGDDRRLGRTLHHQARLQERYERWTEARDIYIRALALKERHQDLAGMAATYHQLGNIYYRRTEHDQSMKNYDKAIALEIELGDELGLASSLMQLAHVAEERFQHHVAYKALVQARPLLIKLHSPLIGDLEKRRDRVAKLMTAREIRGLEDEIAKEAGFVEESKEDTIDDDKDLIKRSATKDKPDAFAEELAAFKKD